MENLQLEASTRRNLELAASIRRRDYTVTDLLAHAQQVVALDAEFEDKSNGARIAAIVGALGSAPVKPLVSWMPHSTAEELAVTRDLLRAHTSPLDLRLNNIGVLAILNSKVTISMMLGWNYTLGEMRDIGFTLADLVTLGFRAAHLSQRAVVSVHVLRSAYACTFESILQIESKFCNAVGVLLSYLCAGLDLEGHRVLGLTNINALRPHNLDRLAILVLAEFVKLEGLIELGLDAQMVREFDLLSVDDVRALTGLPDLASAAAALGISQDEVRISELPKPPPPAARPPPIQPIAQIASPVPVRPPGLANVPRGFQPPPQQIHYPPPERRPPVSRPPTQYPPQPRGGYPPPPAYQQPYQARAASNPNGLYTEAELYAMLGVAMQNE